ncbi:MAG: hypothetical protein FJX74_21850 [Armatimonadetes bacterium]|nr:hypothetical protein [Armatimonadota bacterium]
MPLPQSAKDPALTDRPTRGLARGRLAARAAAEEEAHPPPATVAGRAGAPPRADPAHALPGAGRAALRLLRRHGDGAAGRRGLPGMRRHRVTGGLTPGPGPSRWGVLHDDDEAGVHRRGERRPT